MYINGMQFDCEMRDVISELKEQLILNDIQLFHKSFDSGDNYMICCPYHADGQERRPSCGIRKSDGFVHCFACDKKVGLDEMIANCFGYSDPVFGYRWLVQNFATVQVENRKPIELNLSREHIMPAESRESVSESDLDSYRYTHPYLYQRGLTDEIIARFDIGYDKTSDSITFPVRAWQGEDFGKTLFVARRSIKTKRFDLPKDLDKPLYGMYEINDVVNQNGKNVSEIYLCEGLFDMLRLWCNGKYAVAGFGCLYSEYQLQLVRDLPTRKLILAFDNDKAGRNGMHKIRSSVKNKLITEVIIPSNKKDIGELSDEQIQNLKEVF